jgi:hypothetical protein
MGVRKSGMILLLLTIVLFLAGCGGEDNPDQNEQSEMPGEIMEMESGLLRIMQQADLVPAVLSEQAKSKSGEEEQANEETEGNEEEATGESEEAVAQVSELTFKETILRELLEKEADADVIDEDEELPENTEIIWNDIKKTVTELHSQWGQLEPLLVDENITQEVIGYFEEGLDNLTVFSTERDYFTTMDAANQLTGHLSKFMVPFAENIVALTYDLKFHIRNIVLQAAVNKYTEAQISLDYLIEHKPELAKILDEAEFRGLETSLDNLQRVLDKKTLDLVILKAAVVMENMVQIIEKTAVP